MKTVFLSILAACLVLLALVYSLVYATLERDEYPEEHLECGGCQAHDLGLKPQDCVEIGERLSPDTLLDGMRADCRAP